MIQINREGDYKEKLENICCFQEKSISNNVAKFHFLDKKQILR